MHSSTLYSAQNTNEISLMDRLRWFAIHATTVQPRFSSFHQMKISDFLTKTLKSKLKRLII